LLKNIITSRASNGSKPIVSKTKSGEVDYSFKEIMGTSNSTSKRSTPKKNEAKNSVSKKRPSTPRK
jgi:hypothetical protein